MSQIIEYALVIGEDGAYNIFAEIELLDIWALDIVEVRSVNDTYWYVGLAELTLYKYFFVELFYTGNYANVATPPMLENIK